MRRTVAVVNQKGGVGKTTITLGLASAAAAAGRRVLVVDLDPQASTTWVLGLDPHELDRSSANLPAAERLDVDAMIRHAAWSDEVHVVPSPLLHELESGSPKRLRRALGAVESRYDAVLIDCPPSLGNLTRSALTASRHALLVVEPSALGLRGIGGIIDLVDEVWDRANPHLELGGVILNRVPPVSREADRRTAELARLVSRPTIWTPHIPQRVVFNQAIGERRSIHSFGSHAAEPIAAFDALWRTLHDRITGG